MTHRLLWYLCLSAPVWGHKCCLQDALPPLTSMVPAGSGWGKTHAKQNEDFFLFSTHKVNPALHPFLLLQPGIFSHCPLPGPVTTPSTTRNVGQQHPLSLLSCRFAWQGPGGFSTSHRVWSSPEDGANHVWGLPGKHVVELSL